MPKSAIVPTSASVSDDYYVDQLSLPEHYADDPKSAEMFNDLVECLRDDGTLLCDSDFLAISMVVDTLQIYQAALAATKDIDLVIENSRGDLVRNPLFSVQRQARADLLDALKEIGMTPKSRLYVEKATGLTIMG